MSTINAVTLNSEQVHIVLSNHELFTDNEIKIAAKLKVIQDKKTGRDLRILELQHESQMAQARYNEDCLRNMRQSPYWLGQNNDPYGIGRLVGGYL